MVGRAFRRAGRILIAFRDAVAQIQAKMLRAWLEYRLRDRDIRRVNLCCGQQKVSGFYGVDRMEDTDLRLDLSRVDLPFVDSSLDVIVCMSAINYFTRKRAQQLVVEMYRALKPKGVCRVGVQDLRSLTERYVKGDNSFFFQKLADGRDRFEGPTIGDKYVAWFYGYAIGASRCEYFYDFDSLAYLFHEAGFTKIEQKRYRESAIAEVALLDNREDQMFFLEAVK